MDSVASDWFWFWLPLLVVVVVVVRALAVPSSLLVSWSWLTSLSHHNRKIELLINLLSIDTIEELLLYHLLY